MCDHSVATEDGGKREFQEFNKTESLEDGERSWGSWTGERRVDCLEEQAEKAESDERMEVFWEASLILKFTKSHI